MQKLFFTFFLSISLVFMHLSLQAQSDDRIAEIERQLNRLHQKIEEARHLLSLFSAAGLEKSFMEAERQYLLARTAFQSRQYIKSLNHIKLAYFQLTQLSQKLKNNSYFKIKFREILDQKIQQAEQLVSQSANSEMTKLLNRARYYRQQSYRLWQAGRTDAMLKSYLIAIFFADNAIRISSGRDLREVKNLERYFEDTRNLLNQVEEMAEDSRTDMMVTLILRARQELQEARHLYDQDSHKEAYKKIQLVNRLLYRALDMEENSPAVMKERLEIELQVLENKISELQNHIKRSEKVEGNRINQRLQLLTSTARQKLESEDYSGARHRIVLANRMLYQLDHQSQERSQTGQQGIRNQLQTAKNMLQTLYDRDQKDEIFSKFLHLLQDNYDKARLAYRSGNYSAAIQYLKFFNGLALKVEQMKNSLPNRETQTMQIEESLRRLRLLLNSPPDGIEQNRMLKTKYENAETLYDIASTAWDQEKYILCEQVTRLATNLITQ